MSNLASGRPRLQRPDRALETIGTMRELERDGRLAVEETANGVTIGLGAGEESADSSS